MEDFRFEDIEEAICFNCKKTLHSMLVEPCYSCDVELCRECKETHDCDLASLKDASGT